MSDERERKLSAGSVDIGGESTSAPDDAQAIGRRRFIKGGMAAVPVVFTFTSRPVLGAHAPLGQCMSAAARMSANMSQAAAKHATVCNGVGPRYWRAHPGSWVGYEPGECMSPGQVPCRVWTYGTTFNSLSLSVTIGKTMMQVLWEMPGSYESTLVAAVLNAASRDPYLSLSEIRLICRRMGSAEAKALLEDTFNA